MKHLFTCVLATGLVACNSSETKTSQKAEPARNVANITDGPRVEIPQGAGYDEKYRAWHLAEGSEIYPTLWMFHLKSIHERYQKTTFIEQLDDKYGVVPSKGAEEHGYPIPWIGMTAAWSTTDIPNQEDVDLKAMKAKRFVDLPRVRTVGNEQQISMTGINCTFCHTGVINYTDESGKLHNPVIDGAPSLADVRSFFKDMIGSTLKTMVDEKKLGDFFVSIKLPDPDRPGQFRSEKESRKIAEKFTKYFLNQMGLDAGLKSGLVKLLEKELFFGHRIKAKKAEKGAEILFAKRGVIKSHLVKLVELTYGFKPGQVPDLLKRRMHYLAILGTGDPSQPETISGYGRTDAFARISNLVARFEEPVGQTAPVSLPPMYGMKYKALFHYNANTNSVIARNVGQSFGSGAVRLDPYDQHGNPTGPNIDSTINFKNLIEMEKIVYKMKVPEATKLYPTLKINKKLVKQGCEIFQKTCLECHSTGNERVGPTGRLINYKVVDLSEIGTDDTYINNQKLPIKKKDGGEMPFREGIFNFTDKVKKDYAAKHGISADELRSWAHEDLRGPEMFRDTILGETRFTGTPVEYANIKPGGGYAAPALAGVWATAPYLHNGSVASIYQLLTPSAKRFPKFFLGKNEYDFKKLGYSLTVAKNPSKKKFVDWLKSAFKKDPDVACDESPEQCAKILEMACDMQPADCFDTGLLGNSNRGHEPSMYGGELKENEKYAVIEFLKVLRPEPEYSWDSESMYVVNADQTCTVK